MSHIFVESCDCRVPLLFLFLLRLNEKQTFSVSLSQTCTLNQLSTMLNMCWKCHDFFQNFHLPSTRWLMCHSTFAIGCARAVISVFQPLKFMKRSAVKVFFSSYCPCSITVLIRQHDTGSLRILRRSEMKRERAPTRYAGLLPWRDVPCVRMSMEPTRIP